MIPQYLGSRHLAFSFLKFHLVVLFSTILIISNYEHVCYYTKAKLNIEIGSPMSNCIGNASYGEVWSTPWYFEG